MVNYKYKKLWGGESLIPVASKLLMKKKITVVKNMTGLLAVEMPLPFIIIQYV